MNRLKITDFSHVDSHINIRLAATAAHSIDKTNIKAPIRLDVGSTPYFCIWSNTADFGHCYSDGKVTLYKKGLDRNVNVTIK